MAQIVKFQVPAPPTPAAEQEVAKLHEVVGEFIVAEPTVAMVVLLVERTGDIKVATTSTDDRWRIVGALQQLSRDLLESGPSE